MTSWQKLLRDRSISTLEQLVEKFGEEHFPDVDRLREAAENFEFRISPAMVDLIKEPGDAIWRQYIPELQELEVVDGIVARNAPLKTAQSTNSRISSKG